MRAALDDSGVGHVYDAYKPIGRIDLSWILAEEKEYIGAIGGRNTGV